MEIFSDLRRMVEMGVCYLGLLGVIFTLDAGAFLPALGCFAVSYISGRRRADMEFKREQQGLFPRRAMGYFPECMIRRGCAQEMRTSGMGTVLNEGHDQAARTLQGVNGRWGGKLFRTAVLVPCWEMGCFWTLDCTDIWPICFERGIGFGGRHDGPGLCGGKHHLAHRGAHSPGAEVFRACALCGPI